MTTRMLPVLPFPRWEQACPDCIFVGQVDDQDLLGDAYYCRQDKHTGERTNRMLNVAPASHLVVLVWRGRLTNITRTNAWPVYHSNNRLGIYGAMTKLLLESGLIHKGDLS
jgi:hypothetical protein